MPKALQEKVLLARHGTWEPAYVTVRGLVLKASMEAGL